MCPVYCFWPRIQKRNATRISAHSSDQLIRLIRGWLPILAITFRGGWAPTVLVVGSQSFLVHSERIVSEENVAFGAQKHRVGIGSSVRSRSCTSRLPPARPCMQANRRSKLNFFSFRGRIAGGHDGRLPHEKVRPARAQRDRSAWPTPAKAPPGPETTPRAKSFEPGRSGGSLPASLRRWPTCPPKSESATRTSETEPAASAARGRPDCENVPAP